LRGDLISDELKGKRSIQSENGMLQVKAGSIFDNILVADSLEDAKEHAKQTFEKTKVGEKAMKDKADEEERKRMEEEEKKRKEEGECWTRSLV
jgi:hypothetical protein